MEEIDDELFENLPTGIYRAVDDTAEGPATGTDEGPEAKDMADELAASLPAPELGGSRKSQDVLPLYFNVDSISTKFAAEIIDALSQLSLRTTGQSFPSFDVPRFNGAPPKRGEGRGRR